MEENFYITTTLPYVNAEPHIGFALEIVQADVIARHQSFLGKTVVFNTGTDEHGQKIYQAAQAEGLDTQKYCDVYAAKFDALKSALDLSYTNFIRTTDENHLKAAQEFWRRCDAKGDIYKKEYKVKYCVGCELEKTESELEKGRCPLHPNKELEVREEENYFFKFSNYKKDLLKLYKSVTDFVVPDKRFNEIKKLIQSGPQDFSISRLKEKMPWGVPVPNDGDHVMYVWFDALINYISTLGWPNDEENFNNFWPGLQVAGKDNIRQQSAMWQAMLMSAGLPPSRQILIHGFISNEGKKMSKSLGNVVNPLELAEEYGTDAVRYYLLSYIQPFEDSDFSMKTFKEVYNADLANGLGNLVSRVANLIEKNLDGKVEIKKLENELSQVVSNKLEDYKFNEAIKSINNKITEQNQLLDKEEPWKKSDEEKKEILSQLASQILIIAEVLKTFLPSTASAIEKKFRADKIEKGENLFPRLN